MNILAVVGSPRKGKATDTLVGKAIEGAKISKPDCTVKKVHLAEHDIRFCRNCLMCRDRRTDGPISECAIRDGMDDIMPDLLAADGLILGSPVHMGYPPALMMAFLERICWTFAKPEGREFSVVGCPVPRSDKKRTAIIIVTSGIVPPLFRRFCDSVTPLIKRTLQDSLNARTVGDMYAGDIEHRGIDRYLGKAVRLGEKLSSRYN